jgi:hypothetical protein
VIVVGQTLALKRSVRVSGVARTAAAVIAGAGVAVALFVVLPVPNVPATIAAVLVYAAIIVALGQVPPQLRALTRLRTG